MKIFPTLRSSQHLPRRSRAKADAMTLLEILVVCAVLAILIVILLPAIVHAPHQHSGPQCVNNLKQIGLAVHVWEGDNNDKYPPQLSVSRGGSMEFIGSSTNLFRHFQVMSNELSTPKVLICPEDSARDAATNFQSFCNANISFFFGVDASETNSNMLLSGDRNLTNGTTVKNGILELTAAKPSGWTHAIHKDIGNLTLSDGSVHQVSITGLRSSITNTGLATNRLQMPVLTP